MLRLVDLLQSHHALFGVVLLTTLATPPACTQAYVKDADARMDLSRMVMQSQTNPDEGSVWLLTCLALRERGNLDAALKACDRAVAADREQPLAFRMRGEILLSLGEAERAAIDYAELIELQRNEASGYQLQGIALLALHRNREAFADFDHAIRLRPRDPGGYFVRGSAYEAIKDHSAAIGDFGSTIALAPDNADAWNARCWIRTVSDRQLPAALEDCREAVRLAPSSAAALNSLGFVYLRLHRAMEARDAFTRALARSPRLAASLLGRGIAELRLGDSAIGKSDIRTAKSLEPEIENRFAKLGFKRPLATPSPVGGPVT